MDRINFNYAAAVAIVVAYKHYDQDPEQFQFIGGGARYYAMRILRRHIEIHAAQTPARYAALHVGYKGHVASVVTGPSQEKHYGWNPARFERLYGEFVERMKHPLEVTLPPKEPALRPNEIPSFLPPKEPKPVHPMNTMPVRGVSMKEGGKALYDMLRQAVINTGGKPVE